MEMRRCEEDTGRDDTEVAETKRKGEPQKGKCRRRKDEQRKTVNIKPSVGKNAEHTEQKVNYN